MKTTRRIHRSFLPRVLALAAILWIPASVLGQTLTVEPSCGRPGDSFHIGGSGWAEPDPVCEYIFYFDGTEFAPRQPDGLFGPPDATATVSTVAAGEYMVRVELRLTSDGTLLQQKETKFKVVSANSDPWDGGNNMTPAGGGLRIEFDPKDVCSVTPCNKLVMIQAVRLLGEKADGTTRTLTPTEIRAPGGPQLEKDMTSTGFFVDHLVGEKDPYYNGDDPQDGVQQGIQNGTPQSSIMDDRVSMNNFPADIVKRVNSFEVAVFCAGGQNKGEYVGTMTWTTQRSKGGTQTAAVTSFSTDPPSANFFAALNLWTANHGFPLPTK